MFFLNFMLLQVSQQSNSNLQMWNYSWCGTDWPYPLHTCPSTSLILIPYLMRPFYTYITPISHLYHTYITPTLVYPDSAIASKTSSSFWQHVWSCQLSQTERILTRTNCWLIPTFRCWNYKKIFWCTNDLQVHWIIFYMEKQFSGKQILKTGSDDGDSYTADLYGWVYIH